MTEQELNKACEWIANMPIEYSEFIEKGHCQWIADDFREAMGAVVKESLTTELTWQDIARLADIMAHTSKLTKGGEVRTPEEYYSEVLQKFNA